MLPVREASTKGARCGAGPGEGVECSGAGGPDQGARCGAGRGEGVECSGVDARKGIDQGARCWRITVCNKLKHLNQTKTTRYRKIFDGFHFGLCVIIWGKISPRKEGSICREGHQRLRSYGTK